MKVCTSRDKKQLFLLQLEASEAYGRYSSISNFSRARLLENAPADQSFWSFANRKYIISIFPFPSQVILVYFGSHSFLSTIKTQTILYSLHIWTNFSAELIKWWTLHFDMGIISYLFLLKNAIWWDSVLQKMFFNQFRLVNFN